MNTFDRYAWPATGNFSAHLRAADFYEREWHEIAGAVLEAPVVSRLAALERAHHGVAAVASILEADANARADLEMSGPEHADSPELLSDLLRSGLQDAQATLIAFATAEFSELRDYLPTRIPAKRQRDAGGTET